MWANGCPFAHIVTPGRRFVGNANEAPGQAERLAA